MVNNGIVSTVRQDKTHTDVITYPSSSGKRLTLFQEEVTKSRIRMDLITGSLGEYTYDRLKTHFGEIFGSSNIKDL